MDLTIEAEISEDIAVESEYTQENFKRYRLPRTNKIQVKKICAREQKNASLKKIAGILQKCASERTFDEQKVLTECSEEVKEVKLRWKRRDVAKKRLEEYEDPPDVLNAKCEKLARAIAQSQHLVIYTGAGISTSAKIPDYRGPNGIWTRLQQGKDIGCHDLTLAEPTFTHMALFELYKRDILKYVVSQNCDGLHLRSGLPKTVLSELHGNMYLEICKSCKPHKEYWRPFDVTENTSRYYHKTSRKCYLCNSPLVDSIVHFGERGTLQWPLNWKGACFNAERATTILCLGSSLRVLKKYPWLWQMDKPAKKRPNLYVVNLQWTPKDDCANVKINGKCDEVLKIVMDYLGISPPSYDRLNDPIYSHCTKLSVLEMHTTTQPFLKDIENKQSIKDEVQNIAQEEQKDCFENNVKVDLNENSNLNSKEEFCDNFCVTNNTKEETVNNNLSLQKTKSPPFRTSFSIESILESSRSHLSSGSPDVHISYQTIDNEFMFNQFSFSDHRKQYFHSEFYKTMTDYYYYSYPYESSWMYSGLHSIINPVPYIKEEMKIEHQVIEAKDPACKFCYANLKSLDCLFYAPTDPVFIKQCYRFSKIEQKQKPNICVCCDYSTDEDEVAESKEDENKEHTYNDKKAQPGWFGKGYKKARYKRK